MHSDRASRRHKRVTGARRADGKVGHVLAEVLPVSSSVKADTAKDLQWPRIP